VIEKHHSRKRSSEDNESDRRLKLLGKSALEKQWPDRISKYLDEVSEKIKHADKSFIENMAGIRFLTSS